MKRPLETALWCDCETDEERVEFFRSGRAYDTGIVAKALAEPLASAFEDAAKWRRHVRTIRRAWAMDLASGSDASVSRVVAVPPWGPNAVPLMTCPEFEPSGKCRGCAHSGIHERDGHGFHCVPRYPGLCKPCIQIGWRERSKP